MRRHELVLENIGRFRGSHRWDLTQYSDGIGVVVGPNGSGKTTFVEGMATLAIWGQSPYYDRPLIKRITRGEQTGFAQVVVEASDGAIYRSRIAADKKAKKTTYHLEQLVDDEWKPMAGPGKAVHQAAVARLFGTFEQMLCGPFKDQRNSGSLLTAAKADRRARFAEMLQLDSLQGLADLVKERGKALEAELSTWRAKRDAAQEKTVEVARIQAEIRETESATAEHAEKVSAADAMVTTAAAAHRQAEDARLIAKAKADDAAAERQRVESEYSAALAAHGAAIKSLAEINQDLVGESDVVAAARDLPVLEEAVSKSRARAAELAEQLARFKEAQADVRRGTDAVAEAENRLADARRELASAEVGVADEGEVDAAAAEVVRLEAELRRQRTELAERTVRSTEIATDVASQRTALLELGRQYRELESKIAGAEAAERRIAEAGEIDVAAAKAAVAAAEAAVAAAEAEEQEANAAALAEIEAERERTAATADREKALPRVAALAEVDLDHPKCSVCPLTADARKAQSDVDKANSILAKPPVPCEARLRLDAAQKGILSARRNEKEARDALAAVQARAREHAVDAAEAAKLETLRREHEDLGATGRNQKAELEAAEKRLAGVHAEAAEITEAITKIEWVIPTEHAKAARKSAIEQLKARIPTLQATVGQAETALAVRRGDLDAAHAKVAEILAGREFVHIAREEADAAESVEVAEMRLRNARENAARKEIVERARQRRPAAADALEAAERRLKAATEAICALDEIDSLEQYDSAVATAAQTLATARAALAAAQADLDRAREQAAAKWGEIAAHGDPRADLAAAEAKLGALQLEAEDWQVLQRSLGPDGLQAILIDLAGPEVTDRCNALLESFYGQRFSVEIITAAPKAKGKGTKEVFEIRILDSEFPPDAELGDDGEDIGSGGEMVFIDEALSLAVAMYNAERSGIDHLTLYRDEATGALDAVRAAQYMTMLRKAREIGGFVHIWVIAHHNHIWAQGDFQIFLDGSGESAPRSIAEAA